MPCIAIPPGIRFNDCYFSEPVPVAAWRPPACAGIVAILARNSQWGPKPLQPLYFGEVGRMPEIQREDVLVSVMAMPYATATQRRAVLRELIGTYRPAASVTELARKVDELEEKQQEQNQQILSLLSHLAKVFEPQAVGPRRPIGFLPATAAATESGS